MAQFMLLAGLHVQADKTRPIKDENGKVIPGRYQNQTFSAGQIVESDDDLVAKFGYQKFQLVGGQPRVSRTPGDKAPALNPTAHPAGQVSSGFQETHSLPGDQGRQFVDDTTPRSGIASEDTRKRLEEMEAQRNEEANAEEQAKQSSPIKSAGDEGAKQQATAKPTASKATPAQLDRMSQKELVEYAEDREIDLKGAKDRDSILAACKKAK